jgi:ATP-binding cassette subfamily B protein
VINDLEDSNPSVNVAWIAAIVALGVLRAALMVGRRLISGRQALGVEYDLRDDLYSHFLRLSFGFYDRSQTGQLMSRATIDLQSVRFFLDYGLIFLRTARRDDRRCHRRCCSSTAGNSRSSRLQSLR